MNAQVVTTALLPNIAKQIHDQGKTIVLVGGCFDILHIGHITFLKEAKKQADILMVFVESDETIKTLKGDKRPINTQKDRAEIVSYLSMVDYVITLPAITDNTSYDDLVTKIKPAIIATTTGDASRAHKERQAKLIGAKVVDVTAQISNQSTTRVISILNEL